ncbi:MAG: C39 family peptidase [Myxococcales bacterium]|nr:C39 family peptidase [Myxococcales bacterium]
MTLLGKLGNAFADISGCEVYGERLAGSDHPDAVVLDVPGLRQTRDYSCGYAAALMVMWTFRLPRTKAGQTKSMTSLWYRVEPDTETGTSTTRMIAALRASGIGVSHRRDLDFDQIADAIADGFPIIVVVKTARPDTDHWVVVYGANPALRTVFVAGNELPLIGTNEYRWGRFRRTWAEPGEGLVCWGK